MNKEVVKTPHRARVNGAFLSQYHGKQVCLLGTILKADGGGSTFSVRASDGASVNVRLKQPITEPIQGLVEVYGIGQGRNLIIAESFTIFPANAAAGFDMATYNESLTLMQQNNDRNWLPTN